MSAGGRRSFGAAATLRASSFNEAGKAGERAGTESGDRLSILSRAAGGSGRTPPRRHDSATVNSGCDGDETRRDATSHIHTRRKNIAVYIMCIYITYTAAYIAREACTQHASERVRAFAAFSRVHLSAKGRRTDRPT